MATTESTTGHLHSGSATNARAPHDVRGLWRVGLAVVAPLPMLAKGIEYLLSPVDGGATFRETLAAYRANLELVEVLRWFDLAFGVLLIPATVALVWVARRGAPRLTTVGALICLPAFLTAFFVLAGPNPALLAAEHGLDVNELAPVVAAVENDPVQLVAGLLFLAGIVIGLPVLGVALWRSRAVPGWLAVAVIIGAGTHPFIPGHVAQGAGLLVAAVGFAGASLALLRTPDEGFDLPAIGR